MRPSPAELWRQAEREVGQEHARNRYLDLMRQHGYIVPKDHPDAGPKNLPCGYPDSKGDSE